MNTKTRKLSPVQYIKQLEIEWWICNFRRKIHPVNSQRRNLGKIANLKKERLIDISERNELPHIFIDSDLMKKLNQSFNQNGGGCPSFEGIKDEDILDYYSAEADVRCFYGFDTDNKPIVKIAKIKKCNLLAKTVTIENENVEETMEFNAVSRIF